MFRTLQKNVTTSGTPVQIASDTTIISGREVLIKAKVANTGTICVGYSSASALNSDTLHFKLAKGEACTVDVDNLNEIYIDATVNGEGVEVIYQSQP